MVTYIFFLEKAKSNRARCKGCQETISKDAVRVGIKQEVADAGNMDDRQKAMAEATRWYHFETGCVAKFRKPQWWKANTPTLESFQGLEDVEDDEGSVEADLKKMLEELAEGGPPPSTEGDSGEETAPSSPKKRRPEEGAAQGSGSSGTKKAKTASSPPTATSPEDYHADALEDDTVQQIRKKMKELRSKTVKQLAAVLRINDQRVSGKKDELIERCAEGEVLGAVPRCPECDKGLLRFDRNSGEYSCPGGFENGQSVKCQYRSKDIERTEWKPAEDD